jgi:hypothetical protein
MRTTVMTSICNNHRFLEAKTVCTQDSAAGRQQSSKMGG